MKPGGKVAIVGAGASGLAAAVWACRAGARVAVFELGGAAGRKVLASGGGRCNLGNSRVSPERYHGGGRAFVSRVLGAFGPGRTREFFEGLGLMVAEEPDGRLFPRCGRARAVVDVLRAAVNELGGDIRLGAAVAAVGRSGAGFELRLAGGGAAVADSVILACGGAAAPRLGGGGRGYALAAGLGHAVTEARPSLVPLLARDAWVRRLAGVRVEAGFRAEAGGRRIAEARGEVLFTAYGVSGPAVLDASREVVAALGAGPVACSLDLFPEFSERDWRGFMDARLSRLGRRSLAGFLAGMLPEKLPAVFMRSHGLDGHKPASAAGEAAAAVLRGGLRDWRFEAAGARPWEDAMAAAGGVRLDEVAPETMGSRLVPGLHFAGELLDVDGDSGGFNLHFAWATGAIAGRAAAGGRAAA